jgi:predicted TPR repeat methyltransferase
MGHELSRALWALLLNSIKTNSESAYSLPLSTVADDAASLVQEVGGSLNQDTVARGATVRDVCGTGEESGDRKDAARRKFDRWAVSYERDRRSRFNARPQQEALAALELESDDRFLDVGCGSGAAVRAAAAVAQRAVGVDISPVMIRRAAALASEIANVEFVVGDSEALPFPDGAFT